MWILLVLIATLLSVRAVSEREQSDHRSSILRAAREATSLSDCVTDEGSKRCHGTDFFCRYGSTQGVCMNDTCRCPGAQNRDACTCLPRIGDCHIERRSGSPTLYSCRVPDHLNANYDVHIFSTYDASSNHFFNYHPTATSNVRFSIVGAVVKPIILVLVSYEPIEWRLQVSITSGVKIERVLLSSYYLNKSSVVDLNNRVKTIEKVSRRDFPSGYGEDSGGGNTVKLLESTVARFGPIASFLGAQRANLWTARLTQMNETYLPTCGYPSFPVNGTAALSNTSRGVEVEYSCFTGRAVKGAQSATCLKNGSWSAPPPACPYHCPCPSFLSNGRITSCSDTTVTYTCNAGYTLSGSSTQTCQSDHCPCPSSLSNGRVTSCSDTTVTYACNNGYTLSGSSRQTCQSGGRWSWPSPYCVKHTTEDDEDRCSCPSPPVSGYLSGCPGKIVTYHCNANYVLAGIRKYRVCQSTGTWSGRAPRCLPVTLDRTPTARPTTGTGLMTGVSLAVTAALCIGLPLFGFLVAWCRYKLKSARRTPVLSAPLAPARYTTQPTEALQNSYHHGDLSSPTLGNSSDDANSQIHHPALPCPAYTAQDLPPDYSVVSKDNPPAYQTEMPSVNHDTAV